MTADQKRYLFEALVVILVLVAGVLGVKLPAPTIPEPVPVEGQMGVESLGVATFSSDVRMQQDLAVGGATSITGNTTMAGTLAVTGNTSVTGTFAGWGAAAFGDDVSLTGNLDVGDWASISAQSPISVTAGAIITPTGTLQLLTSAGAVTCSTTTCIADGAATGDVLILLNNNASDAITIDGTGGNVECKADKALGAKDILTLIWGGSDWYCISLADNS